MTRMSEEEWKAWEEFVAHCSPSQKFLYLDDEEIDRVVLAAHREIVAHRAIESRLTEESLMKIIAENKKCGETARAILRYAKGTE